jgi:hypothetical protein
MKEYNQNIIVIDLNKHNSSSFEKLLMVNDLDGKINPDVLIKLKDSGYSKLWVDSKSYEILCYCHSDNKRTIVFQTDFIDHLKTIPSLSFKEEVIDESITYNIDDLLDKITTSGIKSLSKNELNFLNNVNKK